MQPWWTADDIKNCARIDKLISGMRDEEMTRVYGDSRPQSVRSIREANEVAKAKIPADIARFIAVGGDYAKF